MKNDDFIINFRKTLLSCHVVAIAGSQKNTGKTTTLNFIIRLLHGTGIGITSAGLDGEKIDAVTFTEKPRIYLDAGTVVATAKSSLLQSDASFEILNTTGITTPVGEIIIARSRSSGFVELAGPSISGQLAEVCKEMCEHGANPVFIDGSLSRKTFAVPDTADACIYCTGGALSCDIELLAAKTLHEIDLLSLKKTDDKTAALFDTVMKNASVAFVYNDCIEKSEALTTIGAAKDIISHWSDKLLKIFIKGALTDRFFTEIVDSHVKLKGVRFIAEDGTKLFFSDLTYRRFLLNGGSLTVKKTIRLIGVSVNPTAPDGNFFDFDQFRLLIKTGTSVPVFNVRNLEPDVIR